jgi:hypothetical protein
MKIELTQNRNQILVERPYFEMVRLRHLHGLFAEFDIDIQPNGENYFCVETDNETAKDYIDYVTKSIQNYFLTLNQNEISINGLLARISKNKFHAIDSKPICYQISIIECLNNLVQLNTTKRIVIESRLKGTNYELTPYEAQIQFSNIDYDCLYLKESLIFYNETIELAGKYSLRIMQNEFKIIIESKATYFNSSTRRCIGIWFKKNQFSDDEKIQLYETLRVIKTDIQEQGKNLFGFIVYIEKNNDSSYWDKEFLLNFEWSLRNLLSNEKSIEIKKEDSR